LYTPVDFESEKEYDQKLKELISRICELSTEEKAKEIPVMPEELTLDMLSSYPGYESTRTKVPVGIDTSSLQAYYLPMETSPAFVIGGVKTGKTNLIRNMLELIRGEVTYL